MNRIEKIVLGTLTIVLIAVFALVVPDNTITTQYKLEDLAYQSPVSVFTNRSIHEGCTESSVRQAFLNTKQAPESITGSGAVVRAVVRYGAEESGVVRCCKGAGEVCARADVY